MKIPTITTDAIRGFATVARLDGNLEIAIWHETIEGLQAAYERIMGLPFHPVLSQPTALFNTASHDRKTAKTH
jgi:hypothetical protein